MKRILELVAAATLAAILLAFVFLPPEVVLANLEAIPGLLAEARSEAVLHAARLEADAREEAARRDRLAGAPTQIAAEQRQRAEVQRRLAPTASSLQPCSLDSKGCPEGERCYFCSGDFGLGPSGARTWSGGDHLCHRICSERIACVSPEACEPLALFVSDTGASRDALCLREKPSCK